MAESPPTLRVAQILDHLTAHPGESFSLSELARVLSISKPTCLAILGALTTNGYLVQDLSTKAYRLGPSAIVLGEASAQRFPELALLRPRMRELSEETALAVTAVAVDSGQLWVLETAGVPDPSEVTAAMGRRTPFAPPFGIWAVSWLTPRDLSEWLRRASPPVQAAESEHISQAISFVRTYGYLVALSTPGNSWLRELAAQPRTDIAAAYATAIDRAMRELREQDLHLSVLEAEDAYAVTTITAPLFDADGRPALGVVLQGMHRDLLGREVHALGHRLVNVLSEITTAAGGTPRPFRDRDPRWIGT